MMKHLLSYILLLLLLAPACRKVDDHTALVDNQPWLANNFSSRRLNWSYPGTLAVGDTATFVGRLFPYRPGTEIKIGGVSVKIIDTMKIAPIYTTYNKQPEADVIRFQITKDMGVGAHRPVTVTANGITIDGPPLNITYFQAGNARTDTTLWVDSLVNWIPENVAALSQKNFTLVRSIHSDGAGNIWFDNPYGVYEMTSAQVKKVIKPDDAITDDSNIAFKIKTILGSTISYDGNSLYFSAETSENSTDTANNYIFRLCRMDVNTKKVNTVSRTLVLKQLSSVAESGLHYEGTVAQVKIVARNLATDINNNLYFTNYYAPATNSSSHLYWHNNVISGAMGFDIIQSSCYNYVCKLDAGNRITGIISAQSDYLTPGAPVFLGYFFTDFTGQYLYGYTLPDFINFRLGQFDIEEGVMVSEHKNGYAQKSFVFQSFETDPKYKRTSNIGIPPLDPERYFNNMMCLNDGTMLGVNPSLTAYDFAHNSAYCYAGTETGASPGAPAALQNKQTGLAKWVNFTGAGLIGQDKSGAVYFCRGMHDYTHGVTFYKLYSKKQ
ncbi:hypothetical protein [Chitinophaga sp. 212800010-3]|uniref:hypothetical protein n=1 Tax=unclassified Chitinophaga TaxID=2619133 RepID=UPI002DE31086|nr:hypothetical protein [Chitinophaga sp. 212800010-3]